MCVCVFATCACKAVAEGVLSCSSMQTGSAWGQKDWGGNSAGGRRRMVCAS